MLHNAIPGGRERRRIFLCTLAERRVKCAVHILIEFEIALYIIPF